jgi:hypothetical protein
MKNLEGFMHEDFESRYLLNRRILHIYESGTMKRKENQNRIKENSYL